MRPSVWARAATLVFALLLPRAAHAQGWLIIVTGLSGAPQYATEFDREASALATAARTRLGLGEARIVRLGESTTPPGTTENIVRVLGDVASRAGANDVVAIVLIGHGSALGGAPRLNLPGPDLTADQLATALGRFATQEVVVVNAASASGPWIETLSGPRRTIITATRSATERDETVFPRYFADALGAEAADTDKDGRVSLLEAFEYTRQAVDRHYAEARHLRTEHALLDDNGDRQGSLAPATEADGRRAALLFLDAAPVAAGDTALTALYARRDSLQRALAALESRRATTDSTTFTRELEALLLETARTGRAIRERQGGRP